MVERHRRLGPEEADVEPDHHGHAAGDHPSATCDCPMHAEVDSLLLELSAAQDEVRRLRRATALGAVFGPAAGLTLPAAGWRGLLHFPRALWWALADSE
jgi:hypothetical protein